MANSKTNPDLNKTIEEKYTSAAPTSVLIDRDDDKYTLTWKRGATRKDAEYDKQTVKFRRKIRKDKDATSEWKDWSVISGIEASDRSANKDYLLSDYYPTTKKRLDAIQAEVRGLEAGYTTKSSAYKKNNKWYYDKTVHTPSVSDYVSAKFDLQTPNKPSLISVTPGTTATEFTYTSSNDNFRPFADVEYESRLVHNWGTKDPSKGITWASGKTGYKTGANSAESGSVSIAEDTGLIGRNTSYTRVIRMRSRGAAGASKWAYMMYVYAYPLVLSEDSIEVKSKARTGGYRLTVSFNPNVSDTHPASSYRIEYCIGTPINGSMGAPNSPSWTAGPTAIVDKKGKVSATFDIGQTLTTDQALWVRVVQIQGTFETASGIKFVLFGGVTPVGASDLAVSAYDSATKSITLTCSDPSSIATSMLRIRAYYYDGKWKESKQFDIGHGSNTVTGTLDMNGYASWAFDTYVGIGGDYWSAPVRTLYAPGADATNPAAFAPTMGNVAAGSTTGSIAVKWANVMSGVTEARIAVATSESEWTKADPSFVEDVTVTGTNITSANVTGLSYGITYYVKVRTTNSHGTSDWSTGTGRVMLKTDSIPVPILTVSETTDHYIKVSWNWNTWADASQINISWSDKSDFGKSDYRANEYTIDRRGINGTDSFTITENIERGKRWYIQAEFLAENAKSNPGTAYKDLNVNPVAPTNIAVVREAQLTDDPAKSSVRVSWSNNWADADTTEVSWSLSKNAWEANEGLNTYSLTGEDGRRTNVLISNLDMGKIWYFKVKLIYDNKFETSYKAIDFASVDLTTEPAAPVVNTDAQVASEESHIDISWIYSCEDGAEQSAADVKITNASGTTVASFGLKGNETSFALYPSTYSLTGNNAYNISIRTVSANGRVSEWSDAVPFRVRKKPVATITATSLISQSNKYLLKTLPLTVTVSGADSGGNTIVYIERTQAFFEADPSEDQRGGYEGELMALASIEGSGTVTIDRETLRHELNDGAPFRICAIVTDELGVSDPARLAFKVNWTHQAVIPAATREVDEDSLTVKVTATAPESAEEGDCIDIYRLSADKPELIVQGGEFGTTYVDPYPAFGVFGAHRVVYRTLNDDITTANGALAWIDLDGSADLSSATDARLDVDETVINFNGNELRLAYNMDFSHSWTKDFKETKYLGGSVQGDWNPAVSRTLSFGTVIVTDDIETIRTLRRLAVWDGVCHVRTPDGSSFAADVQVSEDRSYDTAGKLASFSMSITRVDPERLEGLTLAEWNEVN